MVRLDGLFEEDSGARSWWFCRLSYHPPAASPQRPPPRVRVGALACVGVARTLTALLVSLAGLFGGGEGGGGASIARGVKHGEHQSPE